MTTPPAPPAEAVTVFGERIPVAQHYAHLLAGDGIGWGLLGPREVPRIWERHLVNCAVLTDLLPTGARVVDVGSGAGLPGLVLAIRRPDLQVDLVESLQRRCTFLTAAVTALGLSGTVRVVPGRAEDPAVRAQVGSASWVTARAVAPLDRLVRWCLPLLESGGQLLAVKGAGAEAEAATHAGQVGRLGGTDVHVVRCGAGVIAEPASVIVVRRDGTRGRRRKGRT